MSAIESNGVEFINAYVDEHHNGNLECQCTETKGRILVAKRDFCQGEVILEEMPLHIVQEEPFSPSFRALREMCKDQDFDYEALWYWSALRSLSPEDVGPLFDSWDLLDGQHQQRLLLLHTGDVDEPSVEIQCIADYFLPHLGKQGVMKLELLLQAFVHNCFDYSDEPDGYATYFIPSFMSHSCYPAAFWHLGDDGKRYILRARRDIKIGEEVTVSYLDENLILNPTSKRRWDLWETKQFWCCCERCFANVDRSRGLSCLRCRSGTVFAGNFRCLDGDAKDGNLLAEAFIDAVCGLCEHSVTVDEAVLLNRQELALSATLQQWEIQEIKEDEAEETEKFILRWFPQHILANKARTLLVKFYKIRKKWLKHSDTLLALTLFYAAVYPGPNAARAWALEAYGDALQRSKQGLRGSPSLVKARFFRAIRAYAEADRILSLMFGLEHEYAEKMRRKQEKVKQMLAALHS
eukprot:TRINITY_DN48530_c0_g1_i1.p1 TRINITY_DN48530_c0_g1~~TRINITY_DN48530_c0_g1_i1.p1  ORF type:complete len:465 (-),score=57.18 TRINITY_DN48530_c0_g1_i1:84-1478(-)